MVEDTRDELNKLIRFYSMPETIIVLPSLDKLFFLPKFNMFNLIRD